MSKLGGIGSRRRQAVAAAAGAQEVPAGPTTDDNGNSSALSVVGFDCSCAAVLAAFWTAIWRPIAGCDPYPALARRIRAQNGAGRALLRGGFGGVLDRDVASNRRM